MLFLVKAFCVNIKRILIFYPIRKFDSVCFNPGQFYNNGFKQYGISVFYAEDTGKFFVPCFAFGIVKFRVNDIYANRTNMAFAVGAVPV